MNKENKRQSEQHVLRGVTRKEETKLKGKKKKKNMKNKKTVK